MKVSNVGHKKTAIWNINDREMQWQNLKIRMIKTDSGTLIPTVNCLLSACRSLPLLEAAVPLDEGFSIMAEDAADEKEKKMLLYMAEGAELGDPCFKVLEDTGVFPPYVIRMAKLGQETGTLDQMMKSLSDYYEKEDRLIRAVKTQLPLSGYDDRYAPCGIICPVCKVMPIFSKVYEQLGAEMSPVAQSTIRLGGIFSGAGSLVLTALIAADDRGCEYCRKMGIHVNIVQNMIRQIKNRKRRSLRLLQKDVLHLFSLTIRSGLEFEKDWKLAGELAENDVISEQLKNALKNWNWAKVTMKH